MRYHIAILVALVLTVPADRALAQTTVGSEFLINTTTTGTQNRSGIAADSQIALEVAWNGRNGQGRMSAAGVYFCRLESLGFSATKRMMLVK